MSLFASNFLLSLCFTLNLTAQEPDIAKGKSLFNANCASCHKLNKKLIGPALKGVSAKYEK
jgi:cytochrome c551/c552